MYCHGTEILPHDSSFTPLVAYSLADFGGTSEAYRSGLYYSNNPSADVEAANIKALSLDNNMSSFRLTRGYMATLATNPDGTGYSRCFIAEDEDLELAQLPAELDGKVSFVRVFLWQRPSKKGWVGGNNQTNPPEGYFDEQCDLTESTWAYSWGTSADWCSSPQTKGKRRYNQEFVPEKWGRGGEQDWKTIANDMVSTHLLSYNEPDHGEQSNVSVEQAIAEWPRHLQSGLRVGSPATTDFRWLYDFMKQCREHNYRVDYVAIHAYWGGSGSSVQVSSVSDWYAQLREVHERTGCPLWITEWNNGANWTHEGWPSDKAQQQEKQRKFMEEILAMMDTCSFIERYSVYNWVEEKRALFWQNKNLTPAGKVYRDFKAAPAFSRECEVIPVWEINSPAQLSLNYLGKRNFGLNWTDENIEQLSGYQIEQSADGRDFTPLATLPRGTATWSTRVSGEGSDNLFYRVVSLDGTRRAAVSEPQAIGFINDSGTPAFGRMTVGKGQITYVLPEDFADNPVVITGPQTFRMKDPMTVTARSFDGDAISFGPETWNYNRTSTFVSRDTVSYMIFPRSGTYNIGGLEVQAGIIDNVTGGTSRYVRFEHAYTAAPAVFATVCSQKSTGFPSVALVSDITSEGFNLSIKREGNAAGEDLGEIVHYMAIAGGRGEIAGREIAVNRTENAAIGTVSSKSLRLDYGRDLGTTAFFATIIPTEACNAAATLRLNSLSGSGAALLANYETSQGTQTPASLKGDLSWCVIGEAPAASAAAPAFSQNYIIHDSLARSLYRADGAAFAFLNVCDLAGRSLLRASDIMAADTSALASGLYIASARGCRPLKFLIP